MGIVWAVILACAAILLVVAAMDRALSEGAAAVDFLETLDELEASVTGGRGEEATG